MKDIIKFLRHIKDLENQLRSRINDGVLHHRLINDKEKWWMLCSSLDILGDTTFAFNEYVECDFPQSRGLKYIYLYGIMQCFILQQDAVKHLYQVFDKVWEIPEELNAIRKVRNASVGHTILNNEGDRKSRNQFNNFVSRMSISKSGFDLLRYSLKEKDTVFKSVKISKYLIIQIEHVIVLLTELLDWISKMEISLKLEFENEKLFDLLPISYWFEKIHSIYDEQNKSFAHVALDNIQKQYLELKISLEDRLLQSEYWFNELEDYFVAIELMRKSLIENDDRAARIYNFYLDEKNDYFKRLMLEIDEKY